MAKEQGAMTAVYLAEVKDEEPGDPEEPVVILGDANGDGIVNIKDVTLLINYLMSENNDAEEPARFNAPSTVNAAALDVNEDGIVNIKDVTALINLLLASA